MAACAEEDEMYRLKNDEEDDSKNLLISFCDEQGQSRLHKAFWPNAECILRSTLQMKDDCLAMSDIQKDKFGAYLGSKDVESNTAKEEAECLGFNLVTSCAVLKMLNDCGEDGVFALGQMVDRFFYLEDIGDSDSCSQAKMAGVQSRYYNSIVSGDFFGPAEVAKKKRSLDISGFFK